MTEPILFNLGFPFGQWAGVAAAFLASDGHDSPLMERLHGELLSTPALGALTIKQAENLADARPKREQVDAWLSSGMASGATPAGGADARLCWSGSALAEALPHARFVVWVEHPAHALGNWLQASKEGKDPSDALELLRSAASGMTQLVQRHGSQCLVVELDDALANPAALAERIAAWLNRAALPAPTASAATNPLALTLAARWVSTDEALLRAHGRLYASCILLGGTAPAQAAAPDTHAIVAQAVSAYIAHLQREQAAALVPPALPTSDNAPAGPSLVEWSRRSAKLLAQLHQVQEELEAAYLRSRVSAEQLALAQSEAESAREAVKANAKAHASLRPEDDGAVAECERLRHRIESLSRQRDLTLVQLHQVQEELEAYYLACKELDASAAQSRGGRNTVRIGRIETGVVREVAPHRELTLTLHDVAGLDRTRQRVSARLVEHHGRPGLALFDMGAPEKPLLAWQATGQEAGSSFVLLIPDDDVSRQRLQQLGSGDWLFVRGIALGIALHLRSAKSATPTRWEVVANRLVKSLADLPARFRFDKIDVQADTAAADALLISFHNVVLGEAEVSALQVAWRPQGRPGAGVQLLAPQNTDASQLFAGWPVEEAGGWAGRWQLPLGDPSDHALARRWQLMSREDRERLLGLLDAMPAAAQRASDQSLAGFTGLAAAATVPLREAYRLIHGSRLRRVWRAARGRLSL